MTADANTPQLPPVLAWLPIVFLVGGLSLSVFLFGEDASYGANQIVLILTTCLVALVSRIKGMQWKVIEAGMIQGIALSIAPIMILLAVGMLIGSWILAGTVPSMIYYGIKILNPSVFYAASAVICAIVAMSIGSSWTVAGTLGIGLMGIADSFSLSPAITAGAIISGAYFGDKLSPLSDTTNLASASASVDLFEHIRHMLWTTVPAFLIALLIFALLGDAAGATPDEVAKLSQTLDQQFHIGPHLLLPMVIMLWLAWRRTPAFPAIVISALIGIIFAFVFQPGPTLTLAGGDGTLPEPARLLKGGLLALFKGYELNTGDGFIDTLLSKGGMGSMLNTVWLILCALGLGGVLEKSGILQYLLSLTTRFIKNTGSLVLTTVCTCLGTNILAADQFMSIAIPGRMFRSEYEKRGLSRLNLSRTLEDSATLTSPLIPWNTCGAYMSATLGISTYSYAPFVFFNIACPIIAVIYAYMMIAQKPAENPAAEQSV